jgi:hypothetical protein
MRFNHSASLDALHQLCCFQSSSHAAGLAARIFLLHFMQHFYCCINSRNIRAANPAA